MVIARKLSPGQNIDHFIRVGSQKGSHTATSRKRQIDTRKNYIEVHAAFHLSYE